MVNHQSPVVFRNAKSWTQCDDVSFDHFQRDTLSNNYTWPSRFETARSFVTGSLPDPRRYADPFRPPCRWLRNVPLVRLVLFQILNHYHGISTDTCSSYIGCWRNSRTQRVFLMCKMPDGTVPAGHCIFSAVRSPRRNTPPPTTCPVPGHPVSHNVHTQTISPFGQTFYDLIEDQENVLPVTKLTDLCQK